MRGVRLRSLHVRFAFFFLSLDRLLTPPFYLFSLLGWWPNGDGGHVDRRLIQPGSFHRYVFSFSFPFFLFFFFLSFFLFDSDSFISLFSSFLFLYFFLSFFLLRRLYYLVERLFSLTIRRVFSRVFWRRFQIIRRRFALGRAVVRIFSTLLVKIFIRAGYIVTCNYQNRDETLDGTIWKLLETRREVRRNCPRPQTWDKIFFVTFREKL